MQDIIAELRDNPLARNLAKDKIAEYVSTHGAYIKGRVTAGVGVSVVTPGGLGPAVTGLAAYGDIRRAIELGADSTGAAIAAFTGLIPNPRATSSSQQCGCP